MDFVQAIKHSISAITKKDLWKDYAIYFVVISVLALITFVLTFVLGLDKSIIGGVLDKNPAAPSGTSLIIFLVATVAFALAQFVLTLYFTTKFLNFALKGLNLTKDEFDIGLAVRYFIATICAGFHILLFWREKKHLLAYVPVIIAIILAVLTIVNPLFAVVSMIVIVPTAIALAVLWTYHAMRLFMLTTIAVSDKTKDLGLCSQQAWELSNKKVLTLFAYNFGFGILTGIAMIPFMIVMFIANFVLMFVSTGAGELVTSMITAIYTVLTIGASTYFMAYLLKSLKDESGAQTVKQAEIKPYEMPKNTDPDAQRLKVMAAKKAPAAKSKAAAKPKRK